MTTIQTSKRIIMAVEVPEGPTSVKLVSIDLRNLLLLWITESDENTIPLPPGEWQLHGSPSEISEVEAGKLVDECDCEHCQKRYDNPFYKCYTSDETEDTALESLHCLLQHHSITGNIILISKPNNHE